MTDISEQALRLPATIPTLQTERLVLRPLRDTDAPRVEELVSDRDIAATTYSIPHPFPPGEGAAYIARHNDNFDKRLALSFAITTRERDELLGVISYMISEANAAAEIGYWIGKPYWRRGYATEALAEVVRYGFEEIRFRKLFGVVFHTNPVSSGVLRKVGMQPEGVLRKHILKWNEPVDLHHFAILREEFLDK